MTYYVGTMPVGEHLSHHGIKGMRWGQRRYQNPDGSLTAAGRVRYGVSNAYSRARSGVRSAGNRAGSWYKKNKKTIKKVGIAVGAGAAAAGATYLGLRYGKGAVKAVSRAAKGLRRTKLQPNILSRYGNVRNRVNRSLNGVKTAAGSVKRGFGNIKRSASNATIRGHQNWYASKAARADARAAAKSTLSLNNGFRNKINRAFGKAGSAVGGFARKAAGATGDAFRGVGYHTRRAGAKAKNAARNVGYKAGNAPYFMKQTASRVGEAAKNATKKAAKKSKAFVNAAKANPTGAALTVGVRAGMGGLYYKHARNRGASKGSAAAIGAARAVGGMKYGQIAGAGQNIYSHGKKVAKLYNSPRAKANRKKYRAKKKAQRAAK